MKWKKLRIYKSVQFIISKETNFEFYYQFEYKQYNKFEYKQYKKFILINIKQIWVRAWRNSSYRCTKQPTNNYSIHLRTISMW